MNPPAHRHIHYYFAGRQRDNYSEPRNVFYWYKRLQLILAKSGWSTSWVGGGSLALAAALQTRARTCVAQSAKVPGRYGG